MYSRRCSQQPHTIQVLTSSCLRCRGIPVSEQRRNACTDIDSRFVPQKNDYRHETLQCASLEPHPSNRMKPRCSTVSPKQALPSFVPCVTLRPLPHAMTAKSGLCACGQNKIANKSVGKLYGRGRERWQARSPGEKSQCSRRTGRCPSGLCFARGKPRDASAPIVFDQDRARQSGRKHTSDESRGHQRATASQGNVQPKTKTQHSEKKERTPNVHQHCLKLRYSCVLCASFRFMFVFFRYQASTSEQVTIPRRFMQECRKPETQRVCDAHPAIRNRSLIR